MDFVEVMEINDEGLIQHHKVYWGWFVACAFCNVTITQERRTAWGQGRSSEAGLTKEMKQIEGTPLRQAKLSGLKSHLKISSH